MRKPKKQAWPVVLWRGKRWLATKSGRVVKHGSYDSPVLCGIREQAEYEPGEKAVRVLVTITRVED
jgi:hypothetical protein